MQSCCFTGHRSLPGGERYYRLRERCEQAILGAYDAGCRRFYAGGALGFDMLAAALVCSLRDTRYPDMRLELILPCRDQADRWSPRDRERYAAMLRAADASEILFDAYAPGVMQARNRALVERADLCIAYMTNPSSGTGGTVAMARRRGIPVLNLSSELK